MKESLSYPGLRIKLRRIEMKLSQGDLAARLSIGQSNLSYIERGERSVSVALLDELAQALRCKPEYFLREFQDAA